MKRETGTSLREGEQDGERVQGVQPNLGEPRDTVRRVTAPTRRAWHEPQYGSAAAVVAVRWPLLSRLRRVRPTR